MIRKVWYKKLLDNKPTVITNEKIVRPDESYFLFDVPDIRKDYTIMWNQSTPSLEEDTTISGIKRYSKLQEELSKIDKEVEASDKKPFLFNGNHFTPDTEFIQGMFSVLNELPDNYTEIWKTTDKTSNGIDNIYVTLNKQGIKGLALSYLQFKKDNWKAGETKKQALKDAYLGS